MTSHLASCWGFPMHIIKSHQKKKWAWSWARRAPQDFGVPFNISATAEASDFKFGKQLGFAKNHHKITGKRKSGRGPGLVELLQFGGSP